MRPLHVAAIRENDDETQGLDITYQAYAEAGLSLELRRHLGRRRRCLGCRRHLFHAAHPGGWWCTPMPSFTCLQQHPLLAKYFFLNLFVMMQLNWKLKAIFNTSRQSSNANPGSLLSFYLITYITLLLYNSHSSHSYPGQA